jgi:flagellar hook-associated protein 3 FlgL
LQFDYTVKANDLSIKKMLVATEVITQLRLPADTDAPTQDDFHDVLKTMSNKLNESISGLEVKTVSIQSTIAALGEVKERHEFDNAAMADLISSVEDADVTETAVKLQNIQLQLEASYRVTSSLSSMNLVNFLGI